MRAAIKSALPWVPVAVIVLGVLVLTVLAGLLIRADTVMAACP